MRRLCRSQLSANIGMGALWGYLPGGELILLRLGRVGTVAFDHLRPTVALVLVESVRVAAVAFGAGIETALRAWATGHDPGDLFRCVALARPERGGARRDLPGGRTGVRWAVTDRANTSSRVATQQRPRHAFEGLAVLHQLQQRNRFLDPRQLVLPPLPLRLELRRRQRAGAALVKAG